MSISPMSNTGRHTAVRFTPDDETALGAIADFLRTSGTQQFPTRASAIRHALQVTMQTFKAPAPTPSDATAGAQ